MTTEELIYKLRQLHDFYDVYIGDLAWIHEVIKLLEKQIPKKSDGLSCPVCKWNVVNRDGNKSNYCRHCGQRLE